MPVNRRSAKAIRAIVNAEYGGIVHNLAKAARMSRSSLSRVLSHEREIQVNHVKSILPVTRDDDRKRELVLALVHDLLGPDAAELLSHDPARP